MFIKEQEKYHTTRYYGKGSTGCLSYPCTATISGNVPSGVNVGASAEGSKAESRLWKDVALNHGTDKQD